MTGSGRKTLMRSLGEFVGHIWQGVKADPAAAPRAARRETTEATRPSPDGASVLTIRRTIIEEVEVTPKDPSP